MGGAASVKAGEDIANTIARAHPMFPEMNDSKVTSMFYTKKEGRKRIFCPERGQQCFTKFTGNDLRSHVSLCSRILFPSHMENASCTSIVANIYFAYFLQSDDTSEFLSEMSDDSDTLSCDDNPTDPDEEKALRETITRMLIAAGDNTDDDDSSLATNVSTKRLYSAE
jgi:hypothetical protein